MKNYDTACAKYYSKLNLLPLPLTTWEFRKDYLNEAILFHKIQANWSAKQDYLKQSQKDNREIIITDKNFKIIFASKNISQINGYQTKEIELFATYKGISLTGITYSSVNLGFSYKL